MTTQDIIIYTTPKKLLHKQDKLENDGDKSNNGTYYWRMNRLPKSWQDIAGIDDNVRLYFATEGFIRGYFLVDDILDDNYGGADIVFRSDSWNDIEPIPITHFQGFKYADKIQELNKEHKEK
jgi:hypothetical protein